MTIVVPAPPTQAIYPAEQSSKKSFRSVLSFASPLLFASDSGALNSGSVTRNPSSTRSSIDTARSYTHLQKRRADHPSVENIFSHTTNSSHSSNPFITVDTTKTLGNSMNALDTNIPRRPPVRVDAQDGPWSVSVAETPHDPRSYSLYIKTPTHNLTLTRTAMEILELDQKLRDAHPDVKIPLLPITAESIPPPPPPKRKSNFLNTLSRLASPAGNKTNRRGTVTATASSTILPTPVASPSGEINDPLAGFSASNVDSPTTPSATSTGLAAYFTTVANIPALRQARVWKRFVRVRTDDLESVRVERAVKRVRSDLAAHVGGLFKDKDEAQGSDAVINNGGDSVASQGENAMQGEKEVDGVKVDDEEAQGPVEDSLPTPVQTPKEIEEDNDDDEEVDGHLSISAVMDDSIKDASYTLAATPMDEVKVEPSLDGNEDNKEITTGTQRSEFKDTSAERSISAQTSAASMKELGSVPGPADTQAVPSRIHRSQSADPDKSSRLSRAFASSAPAEMDGTSSATGDESSISTNNRRSKREKRSRSTAPRKEREPKKSQRKVAINDFEMMRVLGKGCAGKVLLVKHKPTSEMFALKAITKRHVLAHQELQHTLTEQAVLKRMAAEGKDPFVVKLWWSFHDKENLFLVMDFHPGGDLATQLARWGRLGRDRARFYAAEIVEGVEGLHAAGVIYRDLKPENILIGSDGHIVLTDFGLSKEFPRNFSSTSAPLTPAGEIPPAAASWVRNNSDYTLGWPSQTMNPQDQTTTFCGTAEYLAPEVIQGLPYSYEVDWWSFGTMLYEMLTGITPFWANNHSDMYVRVLQDELQFPDDRAMDQDTKSLIRGLLQRNPGLRICEPRIKRHPYFSMIDWSHVYYKRYIPPYIPPIDPSNASDTQNFDDTFLDMEPVLDEYVDEQTTDTDQDILTDTDRTDGDTSTTPSQSRSSSIHPQQRPAEEQTVDVFDGYSFKGRHSVIIDSDEDEETGSEVSDENETGESASLLANATPDITKPETIVEEDVVEPKTPEARPHVPAEPVPVDIDELPASEVEAKEEPVDEIAPKTPTEERARESKELIESEEMPPALPAKDIRAGGTATKVPVARLPITRNKRRERSGIPALDKDLPDTVDEDTEAPGLDDEDDDWDFIDVVDGEDRNGPRGPSLFARGVVDRYRLAVWRKASTPSKQSSTSGMSKTSETPSRENATSPSPQQRRGRAGLPFRKVPRQFLRPKTPPSSYSSKKSAKSMNKVNANTISGASTSSAGLLTPSLSMGSSTVSQSLRSRESATSVGAQSASSDQSVGNGESTPICENGLLLSGMGTPKGLPVADEPEKHKTKKLKRYKEGAEKMFSLFSASPRHAS